MAATEKTYSLIGDVKKATSFVRTHSILSYAPNVEVTEEVKAEYTIPTGTTDMVIDISALASGILVGQEIAAAASRSVHEGVNLPQSDYAETRWATSIGSPRTRCEGGRILREALLRVNARRKEARCHALLNPSL